MKLGGRICATSVSGTMTHRDAGFPRIAVSRAHHWSVLVPSFKASLLVGFCPWRTEALVSLSFNLQLRAHCLAWRVHRVHTQQWPHTRVLH